MPAAAQDAPRPGASTTVTRSPASAARQAMPRPITPPPTTTVSPAEDMLDRAALAPVSVWSVIGDLPSPALPGAGSDGRRPQSHPLSPVAPGSRVGSPAYSPSGVPAESDGPRPPRGRAGRGLNARQATAGIAAA